MLHLAFVAVLLAGQSALVVARTYDLCKGYISSRGPPVFSPDQDATFCLAKCDTDACKEFTQFSKNCYTSPTYLNYGVTKIGNLEDPEFLFAIVRSDPSVPAKSDLPNTCVVCKSENCLTCKAPNVFSASGDCVEVCPTGQTVNGGRGCVCDNPGCVVCIAPEYYSSESKACVLPGITTVVVPEAASTSVTATTTSTPATVTTTITELSTTTPATSTITAVTTAFTGRAECSYYRVTFPSDCCPNKFIPGLRRIRIRRDLERRSLQFTTTTLTSTVTSTASFTETLVLPTPTVSTTETSFIQASTPATTTSTTAFARSTACVASTRVALGRCPTDPKTAMEALLRKYKQSGERVILDCGSSGLYEQP